MKRILAGTGALVAFLLLLLLVLPMLFQDKIAARVKLAGWVYGRAAPAAVVNPGPLLWPLLHA